MGGPQRVKVRVHADDDCSLMQYFAENATVSEMKQTISKHNRIKPEHQILILFGESLQDSMTLRECCVKKKNRDFFFCKFWTCCLLLFIVGVSAVFGFWSIFGLWATFLFLRDCISTSGETDSSSEIHEITIDVKLVCKELEWSLIFTKYAYLFDPGNDVDYRNVELKYRGMRYSGSHPYLPPYGSYFKVVMAPTIPEKCKNVPFIHDSLDNWAIAYHGTSEKNMGEIIRCGRLKESFAKRMQYGRGIYCSPIPQTALAYATPYYFKERPHKMILQVHVNLAATKVISKSEHGRRAMGDYWLVPEDYVRISAVCIYPQPH